MKKNNENKNAAGVQSVADRYSFGHKVLSVALSAVLVGFGWPAVSPSSVYAEGDAATGAASQQSAPAAASDTAASQAAPAVGQAASGESASAPADTGAAASSSAFAGSAASSGSASQGQGGAAAVDQAASEADVALVLGNASITYRDQVIAQPAEKVTVPAAEKFEFTVAADSGYVLTQVKLQVKGADEGAIEADERGVYVVAASDVARGATITLVTEKKQAEADTPSATPIEDTDAAAPKADDAAAGSATDSKPSTSETGAGAVAPADSEANPGAPSDSQDVSVNGSADADNADSDADEAASGDPLKNSLIADVATFASEYGNGISLFAASAQAAETGYAGVFPLVVDNVDVAYFHYNNDVNETLNPTLVPVGTGTLTISNYTTSTKGGAVLFFVKPHANHIFTGIGTDGAGEVYIVGSGNYGSIAGYPGINNIMKAAQAQGYVAAFGFARNNPKSTLTTTTLTLSAKSPDMTLSASSSKTENVVPGDKLTFTVRIQPQTTGSGKDKVTGVTVNSATVNGDQVQVSNLVKNNDGSYSGTIDYTVTEADCARGSVMLDVNATSSYSGTVTPTNGSGGGNGTVVSSYSTITKDASCVCRIAPKNAVDYEFVSGTTGKSLPAAIYEMLPVDTNHYYKGETITPKQPEKIEFEDKANDGYWTWAGWDADSKAMTDDGITFTGTWNFTANESYTVNYVDEQGNEIADPKIVSGNRPGTTVTENAKDIDGYALVSPAQQQSLTIQAGNASANVITFTYKKSVANYTINYVWNGTTTQVRDSKTLSGTIGKTVEAKPEAVMGYTPVSWDAKSVTIDADGNASITFNYYKNATATANSGEATYDGQEHSVSGYYTTGTPEGVTFAGIEAGAKGVNAGDYASTFTKKPDAAVDATGKYLITAYKNGNLHIEAASLADKVTLTTENASKVYDAKPLEAKSASAVDEANPTYAFKIEYQKADVTWTTDPAEITITDVAGSLVGDRAVKVRVSDPAGNYAGELTGSEDVVVTKRPATITGSGWEAAQPYTGQEYKKTDYRVELANGVSNRGVLNGQTVEASYELAGTEVGEYKGSFKSGIVVKSGDEDVTGNYDLNTVAGTLRIVKDEIVKHVTLTPADASKVYDGTPLAAGTAKAADDNGKTVTVEYQKADGTWTTNPADITATDVADSLTGDKAINVRASCDAYEGYVTGTQTLEITARSIELVGESRTVTYNGVEQSAKGITVAAAPEGQVAGLADGQAFEGLTYAAKGTAAGEYAGVFSGTLAIKTADGIDATNNYAVAQTPGTLTINPLSGVTVTITGNSATKTYTGQQQEASGFTFKASTPLYGEGDFALAEGRAALAQATHVSDSCSMGLVPESFANVSGNFSDVTFVIAKDGGITITPAELTVVTDRAEKTYDGTPLTAGGKVNGLVNGETATFTTTGSQTSVGTSPNTYEIAWDGTAKASNYTVSETVGTLTVTQQSIAPGDNPSDPDPAYLGIQVGQLDDTMYNGKEQKFEPKVTDASGAALVKDRDYTLSWSADTTNAGTVKVTVTGAGNYTGSVERGYVIAKRPVSLKSESASKVYDGTALERPDVAVTSQYDFVAGEVSAIEATGSITNAGSVVNAIELTTTAAFKASNYDITKDEGTLTVTKAAASAGITLVAQSASKLYDGTALVLPEAKASAKDASDVTIEYQKADGTWTKNAASITALNVSDSREVQVRASSERNFEGYVYGTAQLSVGVRSVTLKSESASKVYDGTALEQPDITVSGDGFVEGEVSDLRATGSIMAVGSVANAITYRTGQQFVSGNYHIVLELGTLTVTPQSIVPGTEEEPNPAYDGVAVDSPADHVYDGAAHEWAPTVTDKAGNPLVEGRDYTVSYKEGQDFKNVTGAIEATIAGKGNYAGSVTRTYQITPAPLTIETDSDSKTYDGTPLTAGGAIEGVVAGETYSFAATGSQTEVGSSKNTYNLEWDGTAKASNYQVVEEHIGMLTVNEFADEVTVATTGGEFTYDGQPHGATVSVTGLPAGYHVEQAYSNASARNVADGEVAATADVLVIKNAQGEDVTAKLNVKRVDGTLKINPAELIVTTGSAEKAYDGMPAANGEATVSGAQGGDAIFVWATGEQTEVGSSANTYGMSWGTSDQRNYRVVEHLGVLKVNPNEAAVEIKGASASKTYDGTALATNDVESASGLPARFTVELAASGSQTDAGSSENAIASYVIKNQYGEDATAFFSNVVVTPGTLTVTPAGLRVATEGATKTYDGTPLTNSSGSIEGLVAGQTARVVPNGSQTDVGSSENGYTISWGSAKAGNYQVVSESLGALTVTPAPVAPPAPPTPAPGEDNPPVTPPAPGGDNPGVTPPAPGDDNPPVTPGDNPGVTPGDDNPGTVTPDGNTPDGGAPDSGASNDAASDGAEPQTPAPQPSSPIDGAVRVLEDIFDAITGQNVVGEEQILDDGTPLSAAKHVDCWVHYYMLFGMLLTAVYGAGVVLRRGRFSHGLAANMNDVLDAKKND